MDIIKSLRPDVLIVRLDGSAVVAQNMPQPPRDYDLRIRQMGEDFGDGPFARRRLARELLPAQPPNQCCQFLRRLTLYSQRIFTLDVAQNALRVLLRRFLHVRLLQANKFVLHID